MTKQNIQIYRSSKLIHNIFYDYFLKQTLLVLDSSDKNKFNNLDNLHEYLDGKYPIKKFLQKGTDQKTPIHSAIYNSFDKSGFLSSNFYKSYQNLQLTILNVLKKECDSDQTWACQRWPTIRIQFPMNVSVFEFHRDSDYKHPLGEINCFYAINTCKDSSALQVEENLGHDNFKPLNLKAGEYALLNTSIFKHGDIQNTTGKTRVSMDFRFIPENLLINDNTSLTTGRSFSTDSYFTSENELKKSDFEIS